MTQTFKSKMWRICAHCLGDIAPNERACYLADEIACMDCLTQDEKAATEQMSRDMHAEGGPANGV